MSDQNDNVYYILLADKIGKKKERGILRTTSKVDVLPGTLLLLVEERNDKQRNILWWILETLDPENIEIECQPTDTGQLSKTEFAILQSISLCEEHLSIFQDQVWLEEGAQLQINDHVTVAVKGQPDLKGTIKYKGELPGEKGIQFGIELLGVNILKTCMSSYINRFGYMIIFSWHCFIYINFRNTESFFK